jgi:putative Ca2+/H+ antiporter (TMEM165/GDT1 family)
MEMSADGPSEELQEVENELIDKKDVDAVPDLEDAKTREFENQRHKSRNFEILTQALTMTFLAEWGDRSQIATIALAASKNTYGVVLGGLLGHALCTGLAVIGGRMLAAKISERTVSIVGGLGFFAFAIHSFLAGDIRR